MTSLLPAIHELPDHRAHPSVEDRALFLARLQCNGLINDAAHRARLLGVPADAVEREIDRFYDQPLHAAMRGRVAANDCTTERPIDRVVFWVCFVGLAVLLGTDLLHRFAGLGAWGGM